MIVNGPRPNLLRPPTHTHTQSAPREEIWWKGSHEVEEHAPPQGRLSEGEEGRVEIFVYELRHLGKRNSPGIFAFLICPPELTNGVISEF